MNLYGSIPEFCPNLVGHEETGANFMGHNLDPFQYPSTYYNEFGDIPVLNPVGDECHVSNNVTLPHRFDDVDLIDVPDIPDTCFNYISNLLREQDSDERPGATLNDYMAAQLSYNRSLDDDLIGENCSFISNNNQCPPPLCPNSPYNCLDDYLNMFPCSPSTSFTNTNVADNNNNTNFVQNSLVENCCTSSSGSTSDFGCGVVRNLPVDGLGGGIAPVAPPPLVAVRGETHQYEQASDRILDGNCEFGHSIANASNSDAKQKETIRGIDLPCIQEEGNNQQWDMNWYSSNQFQPAFQQNPNARGGLLSSNCLSNSAEDLNRMVNSLTPINLNGETVEGVVQCNDSSGKSRGRKHGEGDGDGDGDGNENREETGRSNKLSAPSSEVFEHIEKYGDVLMCPEGRSKPAGLCSTLNSNKTSNSQNPEDHKSQKSGMSSSKGSKKRGNKSQVIDLKGLLTRCAQCVARVDLTGAYEMLKQIRQHSSPYGDCLQRVAHYLANGLEARLEGKGLELTRANEQLIPSEVLKANRVFVASVPFKIMSYYTTNKTIAGLVMEGPRIHIIDFGISYGLQWPCIIQNLSKRPNGPPRIRITGIDFPQRGFRPAERVEETGSCLAKYCERYNVPFEYHAIAKKWETIQLEDLKIERNEPLVVNCLYKSHNLFDESVEEDSPRDAFLSLVRKINPDIFMHGIVNSTSSVPFFLNRFKEVLFHFTALFDLFEATMSREDNERLLLESKLYGNQALNVIACEGTERVERPEAYKQWQVRIQRAGFVQVALDRELLKRARAMVRRNFREEFSYDEDCHWVVQGWKGRILYAISCWKPQEV